MPAASFRTRLHQAVVALAAVIVASTVFALLSAREIDRAALRSRDAQAVLAAHITLSNSAYNLFKQMSDAALLNQVIEPNMQERLIGRVRDDVRNARALIVSEIRDIGHEEDETGEIDRLAAIEREVEAIIAEYGAIRVGWETATPRERRREIAVLLDMRIDQTFNKLVSQAIAEERREVAEVNARLTAASSRTRVKSVMILLVAAPLTAFVLWYVNRTLLHSLRALSEGAEAFTRGDLGYAIPALASREFEAIRLRLVRMAEELAAGRATLRSANERLEEQVKGRTAELADANRRLEESAVSRRAFFADVSHELRTPLTIIRGEAEIALRASERGTADYRETLQRIVEQASGMSRLVDDLLFIARADAGEPRMEMRSVSVNALLADAARACEPLTRACGVRICVPDTTVGAVVVGDRGRLAQVLGILIDNAVRYSREGGEVRLAASIGEGEVAIVVEDDGIGIAPRDIDRVFDRFYRAENAKEHSGGVGLGLPVAKAIIEAHKGHIRLSASPSGGVVASITLPVETKLRAIS